MLPMWYMAQDRTAWWNKFSFPATRPIYSSGLDARWYDVNKAATLLRTNAKDIPWAAT